MTAIVAVVDGRRVVMGADSLGSNGHDRVVRHDRKIAAVGDYLIGYTSSYRMGQILHFAFEPPPFPTARDEQFPFMVTRFVDKMRDAFREGGWLEKDKDRERGGTFLVAAGHRLFAIHDDLQVEETDCRYTAVGSGQEFARGALHATRGPGLSAEERVDRALRAAAYHCVSVAGPFHVLST